MYICVYIHNIFDNIKGGGENKQENLASSIKLKIKEG